MSDSYVKKVLMTADSVGGVWTYAVELIRAFERCGIEVLLATMGREISAEQWEELRELSNIEVAESSYRLEWMEESWADVRAGGEWLLKLEREFEPDVVHLNGYAHGALPWRAPTVVVGHSCVLSWYDGVKGEQAPDAWARYREEVGAGLAAADLVVAPTRSMLKSLLEHYGELRETEVIPNGRRIELFRPARKENLILSAGRLWDEAKNVRAVCACSLEVSWPICVAGETRQPGGPGQATWSGTANVRPLGRLSGREMLEWFAKASIYAHPAKYEPFGLSVLEAALSGCALVLGDIAPLRENWNGVAVFVDPEDCGQLRDALNRLIVNRGLREELGSAARERALQFDIQTTALRYIEAYEQLISKREESKGREEVATA